MQGFDLETPNQFVGLYEKLLNTVLIRFPLILTPPIKVHIYIHAYLF